MKIMFLVSSLEFGGAERVATVLCNAFSELHQVSLVATYGGLDPCVFELSNTIHLHYLANDYSCVAGQHKGSIARLMKLRHLMKTVKPDVVISFLPNVNVMAVLANIGLKIPLIICERSDPEHFPMSGFWKVLCKYSYQFADMLTVQTSAVAAKVGRLFYLPSLVEVIPNPISDNLLQVSPLQLQPPHILCLGRLTASKQFEQVLQAFATLSPTFPEWELHLIGDGPARQELEQLAMQLGMSAKIRFFGGLEHPYPQVAACDIFAMTSRFEGFPNALLEALVLGRPAVVYDCPSGPLEMTDHGRVARLVPLNDLRQFTDALAELMADAVVRQQLGDQAKTFVTNKYSLPAVIEQWYCLIEKAKLHRQQRG
jgi:glycosyltransferase involved in cell wall biosynthesis